MPKNKLQEVHTYLMSQRFPYHSVSVIHRPQDVGFHVIFMEHVEYMVTEEIKVKLDNWGFTYNFVKQDSSAR